MSVDSDEKLTKFKSAETIVTADFANSVFGGLYGSPESTSIDSDSPLVMGHVHDGVHADGHSQKINLVHHVDDKLLNKNLADDAVHKRNVKNQIYQEDAIPEYEIEGGVTTYYLDLRQTKSEFTFIEDDAPTDAASGITENILIRQRSQEFDGTSYIDIPNVWSTANGRDFVFGSSSLEDLSDGTNGDNRFLFDKSTGAFRAGSVVSDQWDLSNRGSFSVAFGLNTRADGNNSFASGDGSVASGDGSFSAGRACAAIADGSTVFGDNSSVDSTCLGSSVLGGTGNYISVDVENGIIGSGKNNALNDYVPYSGILSGQDNSILEESTHSCVLGGFTNRVLVDSNHSIVSCGTNNTVEESEKSGVHSGSNHHVLRSECSSIFSGNYHTIIDSNFSAILGGGGTSDASDQNKIDSSSHSVIVGGISSQILSSSNYSVIGGGRNSEIDSSLYAFIGGGGGTSGSGDKNRINAADNSAIVGGSKNLIEGSVDGFIGGGIDNSVITASHKSTVVGGEVNQISNSTYSFIGGGELNFVGPGSPWSSVSCGFQNVVDSSTHSSVVSGGSNLVNNSSYSVILSGGGPTGPDKNSVVSSQYSGVLSGKGNLINSQLTPTVGGFSMILSGELNSTNETDFCQILAGKNNEIFQNVAFSSIVNGSQNQITNSTHSSVLSGRENYLKADLSSVLSGKRNRIEPSAWEGMPDVKLATAAGSRAWSYMFGQNTRASGGFDPGVGNLTNFPPGSPFLSGSDPTLNAVPDVWNLITSDSGSSQTFVQTMFGAFDYDHISILGLNSPQQMVATLDGGYDSSPNRGFAPRANSAYTIKVLGVISCAEVDNSGVSTRYSVSFETKLGISTQPDGTIDYSNGGLSPVKIHDSLEIISGGASNIQISAPTAPTLAGPDDFEIFFTHNAGAPVSSASGVASGSELKFVLYNNTFLANAGSPTNCGKPLYGEAVSLRLEVTEINLSLFQYPTPP